MISSAALREPTGMGMAEAACGVLAALAGGAGLAVALFAATMVSVSSSVTSIGTQLCAPAPCPSPAAISHVERTVTHARSIASVGIDGTLEIVIAIVVLVLVAIAAGAVLHGITHGVGWLVLLCLATALLGLATLLTGFSIGLFFAPADAFAVAAVAFGLVNVAPPPPQASTPAQP